MVKVINLENEFEHNTEKLGIFEYLYFTKVLKCSNLNEGLN